MFGVALSFGDLTATLQTQGDYNSMVMEDMCNQARASIIELLAALPDADDAPVTCCWHDYLQSAV